MAAKAFPIIMAIGLGVGTLLYLNEGNRHMKEYFKGMTDLCFTDLSQPNAACPAFYRFHIPGLDHFSCLVTDFFKQALKSPEGLLITRELLGLLLASMVLVAVEGMRPGASGFVGFYPAVAGLSQLLGVSVAFPWFWLSSYWWKNQDRTYSHLPGNTTATRPFVSRAGLPAGRLEPHPTKVLIASMVLIGVVLPCMVAVCWPLPDEHWLEWAIAVFNPLLPLVGVLWMLPLGSSTGGKGHKWACLLFYATAGATYVLHAWAMSTLLSPGFLPENMYAIFAGARKDLAPSHFLFIDVAVLFFACCWFVVLEPLPGSLLSFLILGVLLGPGAALALFLVRREKFIVRTMRMKRD